MARHLAYLQCQVPPGSRAAGVAISRARWHDKSDSHWSQRTPAIFFMVTECSSTASGISSVLRSRVSGLAVPARA